MNETDDLDRDADKNHPSLTIVDLFAIIACWGGVGTVAWFAKEPVVVVIAIAAAYYLAKWIILKKE